MHFKIEDNLFSFVAYNGKYVMLSRKMGRLWKSLFKGKKEQDSFCDEFDERYGFVLEIGYCTEDEYKQAKDYYSKVQVC